MGAEPMADGVDSGGRGQGTAEETVELRITVTGTHTRRDDLRALRDWLEGASSVHEACVHGELRIGRKDSLTQTDAMGGELVQDIIFWASTEAARSLISRVWPSVDTWIRNRRRFAAPGEDPRVTLDGPPIGPGSDLRRDTGSGTGRDAGGDPAPGAGPGPGEPNRAHGAEPGEV